MDGRAHRPILYFRADEVMMREHEVRPRNSVNDQPIGLSILHTGS